MGMKYMLATLCSNPAATKAAMGKMITRILSVVERADEHNHTARHTSALHITPRATAWTKSILHLWLAMFSAFTPTWRPAAMYCSVRNIVRAVKMEPTKLPTYTMPQLRSRAARRTSPLTKAIMIKLLPVNNSAPATTTAMSPRQKVMPPKSLMKPKPIPAPVKPVVVTVKKIAPLAIKAPANIARTNMVHPSRFALSTPTFSIRRAISGGGKASMRICSFIGPLKLRLLRTVSCQRLQWIYNELTSTSSLSTTSVRRQHTI